MRYFHVAAQSSRESIAAHGLDTTRGTSAYAGIEYLAGNYLFTDLDAAHSYQQIREEEEAAEYGLRAESYDLWEVTTDATVRTDEFADDSSGLGAYSVVSIEVIGAEALRLL